MRAGLYAAASLGVGSVLYWAAAGLNLASGMPWAFWHPGVAAFVGSAWVAVNAAAAYLRADCDSCTYLRAQGEQTRRQLAETTTALVALRKDGWTS